MDWPGYQDAKKEDKREKANNNYKRKYETNNESENLLNFKSVNQYFSPGSSINYLKDKA